MQFHCNGNSKKHRSQSKWLEEKVLFVWDIFFEEVTCQLNDMT